MLNRKSLAIISLSLAIGVTSFNYIQNSINKDKSNTNTLISNSILDTESFISDIDANPELLNDKNYLVTQLELTLSSQQTFKELKYDFLDNFNLKKSNIKDLLLFQELTLKNYLEDNQEEGNKNLNRLKECYKIVNSKL